MVFSLRYPRKRVLRYLASFGLDRVRPRIIREIPHESDIVTQGLASLNGVLYESAGGEGKSALRRINSETGIVETTLPIRDVWSEGIAVCQGRLYQLTYRSGRCFVYSLPELSKCDEYEYRGEGWGLSSINDELVMSDGSDVLRFYSPQFELRKSLPVTLNSHPLTMMNDLACVGDRVLVNVLYESNIYEISAVSGRVERLIDASELVRRSRRRNVDAVLNGIAHMGVGQRFVLTGKHWETLF